MKSIFSTTDISDLPESLKKELSKGVRKDGVADRIVALFDETTGKTLTSRQILIGYYRKYGEEKTMEQIIGSLHTLKNTGRVKMLSRGLYEKGKQS